MRKILCLIVFGFAANMAILSSAAPNIVLILTDDHGWSQLSESMDPAVPHASSTYLETPNMVRLMKSGVRFSAGYSPAPLCTPTRRSILCGTSAARSGPEFASRWIPAEHTTIPKSLKEVDPNYRCAHFGKWGEQMISTPEECGYDESDGMTGNNTGGMPSTLGVNGGHEDGTPYFIDNQDPKRTTSVTNRAIAFMTKNANDKKPFYVQISFYAQHLSVVTTDKMLAKYRAKGAPDRGYTEAWAAMMEELDNAVGRVIDSIQEQGIEEETYIFFTADNGGRGTIPGGDEKRTAPNFPLTGAKHSLFEGGLRVPFIATGPGIKANSVCRIPVVGYDFLPTFVELAGGDPKKLPPEVDGTSMRSLLKDPEAVSAERRAGGIIFHRPDRFGSVLRDKDHKLMLTWNRDATVGSVQLFHLSKKLTENADDAITTDEARKETMKSSLLQFLSEVNADKPKVANDKAKKQGNKKTAKPSEKD